jgi:hypothetical protein
MIVTCQKCQARFDDEYRWTICPHETFAANDGQNNFAHHPESYLTADERTSDLKKETRSAGMSEHHQAVISAEGAIPDNEETRRVRFLIGKQLSRLEFRGDGEVYLEFDPFGSITIRPTFDQEVLTSINPALPSSRPAPNPVLEHKLAAGSGLPECFVCHQVLRDSASNWLVSQICPGRPVDSKPTSAADERTSGPNPYPLSIQYKKESS